MTSPKIKVTNPNKLVKNAQFVKNVVDGFLTLVINVENDIRKWDYIGGGDDYIEFYFDKDDDSKNPDIVKVSKKNIDKLMPFLCSEKGQLLIIFMPLSKL